MQIKDLRQFRTFYKESVRLLKERRDEHFIGTHAVRNGERVFGFFEIYHGDKIKPGAATEGISGFLTGFLDMARDAQAVYEFLQNAVDAGSTRFALVWGEDPDDGQRYLLVLNNGRAFDFAAVRSLLNVGVSTKKPDEHAIGKFGIGFKLAHRLVGRDNGLDELLTQHYGPVLFSWQRAADLTNLRALADVPDMEPLHISPQLQQCIVDPVADDHASVIGPEPWLFKILITNFPCQPGEQIRDVHDQPVTAFPTEETRRLSRWLNHYASQLNWTPEEEQQGALFFIKLGQGKETHLQDAQLSEGLRFSLAILNQTAAPGAPGLQHLHLNGTDLQSEALEFEKFIIPKKSDDYRYIRYGKSAGAVLTDAELAQEEAEADIELLLGFTRPEEAVETFEGAPNFYLFFPLSEEKHLLRFILHSNAFYKASHRTSLHVGTREEPGLNERLLEAFAARVGQLLRAWPNDAAVWSQPDKRARWLGIYAALLLSDPSKDANRAWINEPLVTPLHRQLAEAVPVRPLQATAEPDQPHNPQFELQVSTQVRLRRTTLPIDPTTWGLGFQWFYWESLPGTTYSELSHRAISRLEIKPFTILDALQASGGLARLQRLLQKEPQWRVPLLDELETSLKSVSNDTHLAQLRTAFHELPLFQFESDNRLYTLSEVAALPNDHPALVMFDVLEPLRAYLVAVGFRLSDFSLASYSHIQDLLVRKFQKVGYIGNYTTLNEHLSERFQHNQFAPTQKHEILRVLEAARPDSGADQYKRMKGLRLFSNVQQQVVALENLAAVGLGRSWLNSCCLAVAERPAAGNEHTGVGKYPAATNEQVWSRVVVPLWEQLIQDRQVLSIPEQFYKDVTALHSSAPSVSLPDPHVVLRDGAFLAPAEQPALFVHRGMAALSREAYQDACPVVERLFGCLIPDGRIYRFLHQQPFNVPDSDLTTLQLVQEFAPLTVAEAEALARWLVAVKAEIGSHLTLEVSAANEPLLRVRLSRLGSQAAWLGKNPGLAAYVARFHAVDLVPVPAAAPAGWEELVELRGPKLWHYLIGQQDVTDDTACADLARLLLGESDELKLSFLEHQKVRLVEANGPSIAALKALAAAARLALSLSPGQQPAGAAAFQQSLRLGTSLAESFSPGDLFGGGADTLVVLDEERRYELSVAQLFPGDQSNDQARQLETLGQQLLQTDASLAQPALWQLLNLSTADQKQTWQRLLKQHAQTGFLENGAQLALAMLALRLWPETRIAALAVRVAGQVLPLAGEPWGVGNVCTLFAPERRLPDCYDEAASLLHLSDQKPAFTVPSTRAGLYLHPHLDGGTVRGPRLRPVAADDQAHLHTLLDQLADWPFQHTVQLATGAEAAPQSWPAVLGFDPKRILLHKLCWQPDEAAPPALRAWWQTRHSDEPERGKRKTRVVQSLGISQIFDPVCQLRLQLLDEEVRTPISPVQLAGLDDYWLGNTLRLVQAQKPEAVYSPADAERWQLLQQVVQRLVLLEQFDQPLPVRHTTDSFRLASLTETACYLDAALATELARRYDGLLPTDLLPPPGEQLYDATIFTPSDALKQWLKTPELIEKVDEARLRLHSTEWEAPFYRTWRTAHPAAPELRQADAVPVQLYWGTKMVREFLRPQFYTPTASNGQLPTVVYTPRSMSVEAVLEEFMQRPDLLTPAHAEALRVAQQQFMRWVMEQFSKAGAGAGAQWQREAEAQQRKDRLRNELAGSPYTYGWFKAFLDLWHLQGPEADQQLPEREISFGRAMPDADRSRIVALRDPSRAITPTIENCADFIATLVLANGRTAQVAVLGVSKKGQGLELMLSNPHDQNQPWTEAVRVELRFSPVIDLIGRLQAAFRQLGTTRQWPDTFDLLQHLPDDIDFVFGPPGTGKTTTLARRLSELLETHPTARVLVLAPTNTAADEVAEKILHHYPADAPPHWLVRYGATFSPAVEAADAFYDGNSFALDQWAGVLITTIHRYPYERVLRRLAPAPIEQVPLNGVPWDCIVLDEASMIALPYAAFVLHQRTALGDGPAWDGPRFVVGGDPLQLPPVVVITNDDLPEDFDKEQNIYTMVGLSSFDEAEQAWQVPRYAARIHNLTEQFRSVRPLGELFSCFTYGGRLQHGRERGVGGPAESRPLPASFARLLRADLADPVAGLRAQPLALLRFPVNSLESVYRPGKLRNSPYHLHSALLVLELVQALGQALRAEQAAEGPAGLPWTVGLICPYRAQATLLEKMVEALDLPDTLHVQADTVHGFQGGQCDMVFVLLNPSAPRISRSNQLFLHKHHLLNVAISRSRDYLFLLYPDQETDGIGNLHKVHRAHANSLETLVETQLGWALAPLTVEASALETRLFGESQHIQQNIFTHQHQLVNVYARPQHKYTVKESTTAIDVQFQH